LRCFYAGTAPAPTLKLLNLECILCHTTDAATAAEELSSRSSEGLGWTKARAQGVVKKLADDGVAWIDGPEGGGPVEAQYFVLSVWLDRQAGNEEDAGRKDGGES
jgi:hypothetical protein